MLAHPGVRTVIDPAEPVCVILGLVLSLMPVRQAREVVAGYTDLVAPGSYVVISCGRCDDEALWKQLREAYTAAEIFNHAPGDVEGFLAGLELVPPGVVAAQNWRGGWHDVPAAPPGPVYVLDRCHLARSASRRYRRATQTRPIASAPIGDHSSHATHADL